MIKAENLTHYYGPTRGGQDDDARPDDVLPAGFAGHSRRRLVAKKIGALHFLKCDAPLLRKRQRK